MVPAKLEEASKDDLKEELLKIRTRERRLKEENKAKTAKLLGSAFTIVSAGGLGFYLGGKEKAVREKHADWSTMDEKVKQEELSKEQDVFGVPLDLLVGVVGIGFGLMDAAGEFGDTLNAIGVGGISSYASRSWYAKARDEKEEEKTQP